MYGKTFCAYNDKRIYSLWFQRLDINISYVSIRKLHFRHGFGVCRLTGKRFKLSWASHDRIVFIEHFELFLSLVGSSMHLLNYTLRVLCFFYNFLIICKVQVSKESFSLSLNLPVCLMWLNHC